MLIIGVAFYIMLPPINLHAGEFWSFLLFAAVVVFALDVLINGFFGLIQGFFTGRVTVSKLSVFPKRVKIALIIAGI